MLCMYSGRSNSVLPGITEHARIPDTGIWSTRFVGLALKPISVNEYLRHWPAWLNLPNVLVI